MKLHPSSTPSASPIRPHGKTSRRWLICTDLDGSLLDDQYRWSEAQPALDRIREKNIPLCLNTSKTFSEVQSLLKSLDLDTPAICENGGIIAIPLDSPLAAGLKGATHCGYRLFYPGLDRRFLIQIASDLRNANGYRFQGFSDLTETELVQLTGLSPKEVLDAKCRHATEPIIWNDTPARRLAFTRELADHGIRLVQGGRFFHIMGQVDKSDGLSFLAHMYRKHWPLDSWTVIALGDSANDLAMLSAADIAGVIPDRKGNLLNPTAPSVIRAQASGPAGWNEIMQQLFDHFGDP